MAENTPGMPARLLPRAALWLVLIVTLLWLAYQTTTVLLAFFFAIVLSIVLSAPVTWLEDKGLHRVLAALLVGTAVLVSAASLGWLVVPRVVEQARALARNVPEYAEQLRARAEAALGDYPEIGDRLPLSAEKAADLFPSTSAIITQIGSYSVSALTGIALVLVFLGVIIYSVVRPRPLLRLYIELFPAHLREPATRALGRASSMVVGWMWANVIVGAIEAVATGVFLTLVGVPGVLVWAALAFFAELVPKVGIYIMAVPPILVALATDPMTALWVTVFYMAMSEIMGDIVTPRIRSSTMNLHPVSILFVMLVMAAAFGLAGALIATPITAFIKAYYEEFHVRRLPADPSVAQRVEAMLHRTWSA